MVEGIVVVFVVGAVVVVVAIVIAISLVLLAVVLTVVVPSPAVPIGHPPSCSLNKQDFDKA